MAKESRERHFPCHGLLVALGVVDSVHDRVPLGVADRVAERMLVPVPLGQRGECGCRVILKKKIEGGGSPQDGESGNSV